MGYKSQPGGWRTDACFGPCRWRNIKCDACLNKSEFEDCRETCINHSISCNICQENSEYKEE